MKKQISALILVCSPLVASALEAHLPPSHAPMEAEITLGTGNSIAVRIPHVMFLEILPDKTAVVVNNHGTSRLVIDGQADQVLEAPRRTSEVDYKRIHNAARAGIVTFLSP